MIRHELTFQERYPGALWYVTNDLGMFVGELIFWGGQQWMFRSADYIYSWSLSQYDLEELSAMLTQLNVFST